MNIGILGSGEVGRTLAKGLKQHGYEVMVGSRDKEKLKDLEGSIRVGDFDEAAEFGEVIILSVKGTAAKDALGLVKEENFEGKTIIDTTNPISDEGAEEGVLKFFTTLDDSLMEQLQESFPKANFVKAFNSIGSNFMVNPDFEGIKPTMFICGNNKESKEQIGEILEKLGFEVEDFGGAKSARAIEPLCMLWCIPGFLNNEWSHAFKLLKK